MPQRYRYVGETEAVAPWLQRLLPDGTHKPLAPGEEFETDYPINNAAFARLDAKGKELGPATADPEPDPKPEPEPEAPTPLDEPAPNTAPQEA